MGWCERRREKGGNYVSQGDLAKEFIHGVWKYRFD